MKFRLLEDMVFRYYYGPEDNEQEYEYSVDSFEIIDALKDIYNGPRELLKHFLDNDDGYRSKNINNYLGNRNIENVPDWLVEDCVNEFSDIIEDSGLYDEELKDYFEQEAIENM